MKTDKEAQCLSVSSQRDQRTWAPVGGSLKSWGRSEEAQALDLHPHFLALLLPI